MKVRYYELTIINSDREEEIVKATSLTEAYQLANHYGYAYRGMREVYEREPSLPIKMVVHFIKWVFS